MEGRIAAILNSTRSRAMLGKWLFRVFVAVALLLATIFGTCRLTSWADDATEQEVENTGNATPDDSEASTMVVRVLSEDGEPLSDANIKVSIWEMQGANDYPNRDNTTDEQGRAEIERPRRLQIMRMWPAKGGYVPQFVKGEPVTKGLVIWNDRPYWATGVNETPNDHYRVRLEADGYRSVVSDDSFDPLDGRATLDVALHPAPPRKGRIVDANGRPVNRARVLQASPTEVPYTSNGQPESYDSRSILTDVEGSFELRATSESVRVRAYHDFGFAEKALTPDDDEIGVLKLEPWASVSGRLVQAGSPIAGESIYFHPLARRGLTEARFQDSFYAQTDADGHFQFDRISPTSGTLKAYLGPWRESPLTSSESIPLELAPGEHRDVTLGGSGATITGRVVATGRSNDDFSKQWSLNYLISRNDGVAYPEDATPLSFDPSGNVQAAWLRQHDFQSWVATRRNYFVKLSDDGRLAIYGVDPGEYDLAEDHHCSTCSSTRHRGRRPDDVRGDVN